MYVSLETARDNILLVALFARFGEASFGVDVLLISVRTEDTRLINRAFTLASSRWPPKPGSAADAVQPTN